MGDLKPLNCFPGLVLRKSISRIKKDCKMSVVILRHGRKKKGTGATDKKYKQGIINKDIKQERLRGRKGHWASKKKKDLGLEERNIKPGKRCLGYFFLREAGK